MKKNEVMKKVSKEVSQKKKTVVAAVMDTPEYWEQVKRRARQIYEERVQKKLPGDQTSDWLRAEQEVSSQAEKGGKGGAH